MDNWTCNECGRCVGEWSEACKHFDLTGHRHYFEDELNGLEIEDIREVLGHDY